MGVAYGKLERHDEEVSALVEAIKLQPHNVKIWRSLGTVYNILGQNELALDAATKVVELSPVEEPVAVPVG